MGTTASLIELPVPRSMIYVFLVCNSYDGNHGSYVNTREKRASQRDDEDDGHGRLHLLAELVFNVLCLLPIYCHFCHGGWKIHHVCTY